MSKLTTIIGSALVITGISGASAWATEALPVLDNSSGILSASNLYRGDTLTFSVRVTDDVACCSWVGWGIYSEPGNGVNSGNIYWNSNSSPSAFRISGNEKDGRYQYSLSIPNNTQYGTYYLKAQAIDNAGGYTHLDQIGSFTVSARPGSAATTPSASPATTPSASPATTPSASPATTDSSSPTPQPSSSATSSVQPTPTQSSESNGMQSSSESLETASKRASLLANDQNASSSSANNDNLGIGIGIAGAVLAGAGLGILYAHRRQMQGKPLLPSAIKQTKTSKSKLPKNKK